MFQSEEKVSKWGMNEESLCTPAQSLAKHTLLSDSQLWSPQVICYYKCRTISATIFLIYKLYQFIDYNKNLLDRYRIARASLVAQMVKNPPAKQESQVQSLGQEDLLEKEMITHASILT